MKTIYPSKNFKAEIKRAFDIREPLVVSIDGGWRGKLLAKEVGSWLPVNEIGLIEKGPWKGPSNWCGLFMMPLYTAHYMAISADYELKATIDGNCVTLNYIPLGGE
jgi:hypothetical protein